MESANGGQVNEMAYESETGSIPESADGYMPTGPHDNLKYAPAVFYTEPGKDGRNEPSGTDALTAWLRNAVFIHGVDDKMEEVAMQNAVAWSRMLNIPASVAYEYGPDISKMIRSRADSNNFVTDSGIADPRIVMEDERKKDETGRFYGMDGMNAADAIAGGSPPQQPEGRNPFRNIYEAKRRSRAELTYEELQARLASDWMREGMSKEAAMAEAYGHTSAQTEAYDPFTLFAGGLGAGYRLGNTAASVGERLFRAGVQSAVMTAADIPISGMITPAIEEKYPGLALPANLILSVISGISIEKGAEKGLIKLLESKGIKNAGAAAAEIKAGLAEKAGSGELGTMLDKAIEARGGAADKIRPPATDMNAAGPAEGVKAEGVTSKPINGSFVKTENLPKNTIVGDEKAIGALVDFTLEDKTNVKRAVRFQTVTPEEAASLKERTSLELEGYHHTIDNYGIKHVLEQHGDLISEGHRGQLPIERSDIQMIPEIVNNYDSVKLIPKGSKGDASPALDLIRYEKRIDGSVYYVEEIRTGRNELTTKSLWKTRAAKDSKPDGSNPFSTP